MSFLHTHTYICVHEGNLESNRVTDVLKFKNKLLLYKFKSHTFWLFLNEIRI